MSENVQVLKVFAREGEGGNFLGVVLRHFDPGRMQEIAHELGYPETIFVDGSEPPRVRIFTPQTEVAFAGHPLVGVGWFLQQHAPIDMVVCDTGPVRIWLAQPGSWIEATGDQAVTPLENELWPGCTSAAEVRMPLPYLMIELESAQAVSASVPSEAIEGYGQIYLWARQGDRVRARFFAPGVGISEDPATGSAAAALAALLRFRGEGTGRLEIDQGEEMGQPCRIVLDWDQQRTRLGGEVISDGVLAIK